MEDQYSHIMSYLNDDPNIDMPDILETHIDKYLINVVVASLSSLT